MAATLRKPSRHSTRFSTIRMHSNALLHLQGALVHRPIRLHALEGASPIPSSMPASKTRATDAQADVHRTLR